IRDKGDHIRPPWWRSFVGKRRKAARESACVMEQDLAAAEKCADSAQPASADPVPQKTSPAKSHAEGGTSLLSDETYDDSGVQPTFSESTDRRNLRVSRSGRFKEKRRTRVGLPQDYKDEASAEDPSKRETHSPK
uniref:Uncharacterized protein n=1 Tax=Electrophorus electricus TaxID=8005 RepID=A0A4W4DTH9_ELEEL